MNTSQHTEFAEGVKVTYADILSLGESNQRIELFDGECIMTAMPSSEHQYIATNLASFLREYVRKRRIGRVYGSPVDVCISQTTVFQPDLSYVSNERADIDDGKKFIGAPSLVIEVLSESTEERDRTFKFREYARGGAKEYWLVSPGEKQIEVYKNSERGFQLVNIFRAADVLNSPLFADINLDVKQVFE